MAAGYQAVPDVEQPEGGDALPLTDVIVAKAQAKYPEAGTKVEAVFLGRLDDAIDNAQPKISIPRITAEQLKPSTEIKDDKAFLKALQLPTAAFVVMVVSALVVILTENPLAQAIYPYFACVVTFASSIPDIRKRFLAAVAPVFNEFSVMKGKVEKRVEEVSIKGFKYLNITETAMNDAIAPIKDKLEFATTMETALRQIDPTIDIPDTTDIEETFNGFEDQLKTGFQGMEDAVDLSRDLPEPLKSIEKYQLYVMAPFLAVMLVLQLWGVYVTTSHRELNEVSPVNNASEGVRFLVGSIDGNNVTTSSVANVPGGDVDDWSSQWFEILIAVQTYVSTVLQITVAFLMTQAKVMAALINVQIGVLESRVNKELRDAVGDVFDDIFKKGFGMVKKKFLDLVHKIDKIEGPINEIKSKIPGGGNLPSSLVSKIPSSITSAGSSFFGKFGKS